METENLKQNFEKIVQDLNDKYLELKNAKVKIAISGQSGTGKSSMINAIIGKKIADVGSVETTLEIKSYSHVGLDFYDIPGCGTSRFPKESYIQDCSLESYDAVIIVTANRFQENDLYLISEMIKKQRPVYVVRTKMDEAVTNEMRDNNLSESQVFEKVRKDLQTNLNEIAVKGVYLISSAQPIREDFSRLLDDIQHNLKGIKKDRFIADVTPYNKNILADKKILARQIVSNRAYLAALNGINPIFGLDISLDIALLINMAKEIQAIYGLDEETIEAVAKKTNSNASFTAIKTKAGQFSAKFIAKEGVLLLLKRLSLTVGSKEVLKYIPFLGQALAAGIGYKMADSFGSDLIDESDALADEILEKITLKIGSTY